MTLPPSLPAESTRKDYYPERERILDIARAEFIAYGFQRTTIARIAERSNVSRITVNRHCGDKSQIILTVIQRELDATFRELAKTTAPIQSPVDRAVEVFVQGWLLTKQNAVVTAVIQHEPENLQKLLVGDGAGALFMGIQMWASLIVGRGCSQSAAEDAAELLVRMTTSLLLLRGGRFQLDTEDETRRFANKYFAPLASAAVDTDN
ncbi:Putative transcriptional regulator, TetR family [Mycobacteroides abscessus subsp. bolletii]|uniref:TetR/AcrR family transcriptional regulator n=1 Tax=Mycobacteroides abscessus TaxID=36809 RepID=UPI000928FF12|nr:TetR/AcrR family transcriptional regulator [Mycobacteroides abscessus]SHX52783.1 Putative transcriptional regulator, TetR family [Mycobacteroides abscessus subsp. bolletii]SKP62285.1 Putative transcriptional regulator, TetR family [Mycobacteroides abscessus subsp. bolletii]SKP73550.1 Putative transcriptional regulator, TetR family [Mycobacteroides abscessus subsp. bolletii]SKQ21280.1 Putative transcriptional regulator, TetR family [Mycobacteroides abscessus subsp. bolletii]